jgi:hypothetical protein
LVTLGLTLSMGFAYLLGPIISVTMVGRREIRILPLTNRDLWVATWLFATLVIPLAVTVVQCVAVIAVATFTGSSAVSTENLLLASLYCFAYAGALVPIVPAQGYATNNITTRQPRWLWIALSIGCFLLFSGALVLPYFIADDLPLTFDQSSWGSAMALLGCFAISAASLAWTPQRGGTITPVQPARKAFSTSGSKDQRRFVDRFTGIPRVAWPYVIIMVMASAGTVAAFVSYWAVFESGTPLRIFLQENALLLFDGGFVPNPDVGGRIWAVLAVMFLVTGSPWKPFGRLLKVLPFTTHRVNVLFLATPFVQVALVWLVLIALHIAVIGALPDTVRADVFVFVGGVAALGQALTIRRGHMGTIWIPVLIGGFSSMATRVMSRIPVPVEVVLVVTGLIALAVAAFVNHRTLSRSTSSSKAYRPDSLPFGINAPGARP